MTCFQCALAPVFWPPSVLLLVVDYHSLSLANRATVLRSCFWFVFNSICFSMPRFYNGPDRRYVNCALPTDQEIIEHAIAYIDAEIRVVSDKIDLCRGYVAFGRIASDIYESESHIRDIAMRFSLLKQDVDRGVGITHLHRDQMKYLVDLLEDAKSVVEDLLSYGGFTVIQSK